MKDEVFLANAYWIPPAAPERFLVEALRRYLKASEQVAEEKGWPEILKELCNRYYIVGFDIHPFATFMAQMQFMLVLIPAYKRAMDKDWHFVLNRLPIFRTDSLIDETKGETRKVTLETFESAQYILIDTGLPVDGRNLKIQMPYFKDVIAKTDLPNVEDYFAALQAVFDTVKEAARKETYEVDTAELERNFKRYLEAKNWNRLVSFFTPHAKHFLRKFKELKETFGDGKLIKSLEDIMLAAILKNYVQYDYVVENPPYVRTQAFEKSKDYIRKNYESAYGNFDMYVPFMERSINWLYDDGKFGIIVSNMFANRDYGTKLRDFIINHCIIEQYIDFGASGVFEEVTNYPVIIIFKKGANEENLIKCLRVASRTDRIIDEIRHLVQEKAYSNDHLDIFEYDQALLDSGPWKLMPKDENVVFKKIEKNANCVLMDVCDSQLNIKEATRTGANEVYILTEDKIKKYKLEEELLIPKIKGGEEIKRWNIAWDGGYILFPYKLENGDFVPINLDQYPFIRSYLIPYKEKLEKRRLFNQTIIQQGKNWFELWNPLPYNRLKIVYPEISNVNSFAFDEYGFYCVGKCFIIYLRSDERKDYLYTLGLLNSKVLEFYFKHVASIKRGNYFEYMGNVGNLPFIQDHTSSMINQIAQKVDLIIVNKKLEQNIEHFPEAYIQEYRGRGEEFEPVSITFNSTYKALEPLIEEDPSGRGYNIVIGKKEKPVFVDSKPKADYVVAALKGKRAKKDEKPQLLVPKSDAIVKAILKELEEDKAQVTSPSVAELEAEINELVYKLYGLNDEDIKVIEEFLKRF
ncbi:MAG: hypothetical protein EFT35_04360 [Methanophagales archaeon ANME-1-THS]|nr:MAG: hypothetical protein EFT35_04360 [Methanophagales archaeon ANME-1-THS]